MSENRTEILPVRTSTPSVVLSSVSLVIANLVPLFGVLFLGWSVFSVLLLYWLEIGVVCFFSSLKIVKAEGVPPPEFRKMSMRVGKVMKPVAEFTKSELVKVAWTVCVIGMSLYGIALFAFFSPITTDLVDVKGTIMAFAGICFSHALSYRTNYIGKAEYRTIAPSQVFYQPIHRLVVMHITVCLGAVGVHLHGGKPGLIIAFILTKILFDLSRHLAEHKRTADRPSESSCSPGKTDALE